VAVRFAGSLSGWDKPYSDLMRELWGSPGRWNVKKSYADVAKRLGVDEETVRNRLKRLRESGFLLGWRLVPNPALMRRSSVMQHLVFGSPESKQRAVSLLARMEGVVVVASLYGSGIVTTLFDTSDHTASRRLATLGARAKPSTMPGMSFPPTTFQMTPTDWEIVRLMLRDAERNVNEVAAELKVSARTVKRRLDSMMASSAIFIMPMIDQAKSNGVAYQLFVESDPRQKAEVDRLVSSKIPNLVFRAADSSDTLIFGFTGKNVIEGRDVVEWAKRQPGVRSARINIVEEVVYAFRWLESEAARFQNAAYRREAKPTPSRPEST
jgi:DNA-binding Lrp family transcriptional regulator